MIGIVIGISGIVITIILGLYTIYKGRKSKKKIGLTFEKKECYSLFGKDVKRLNIDINYKQKPITNSLILLKAILRNNGQLDIDESSIYKPLIIISDKKYSWLEFNIISKPKGVHIRFEKLNDTQLQIKWDLLKVDESIEFEVLINIVEIEQIDESAIKFYNSLKFDYRITNLNKIEIKKEIPKPIQELYSEIAGCKYLIFLLLAASLFIVIVTQLNLKIFNLPPTGIINYEVYTEQDTINIQLKAHSYQLIKIKNTDTKSKKKLSISKFNENYKIQKIVNVNDDNYIKLIGLMTLSICLPTLIITIIYRIKLKKKLKIGLKDY